MTILYYKMTEYDRTNADKKYRETHKEELKAKSRIYREANKDKLNETKRIYRKENKEAYNERQRERRALKAKEKEDDKRKLQIQNLIELGYDVTPLL